MFSAVSADAGARGFWWLSYNKLFYLSPSCPTYARHDPNGIIDARSASPYT